MPFFTTFARLFHDLSVYRNIINQKLAKSFAEFLLFYLLFSIATAIWFSTTVIPRMYDGVTDIANHLLQTIPDNAAITIENGKLTTENLPAPFTVPLPQNVTLPDTGRLLYLDQTADLSALATSSALVSFGATEARFTSPGTANAQVEPYSNGSFDTRLTGSSIHTNTVQLTNFLNRIRPLLPAIMVLPIFFSLIAVRLIYTLVYALLFTLGGSLFNRRYSFKQFFSISLYTVIVADTINGIITLTYGVGYPLVFSLAFLGVTLLAYFSLPPTTIPSRRDNL